MIKALIVDDEVKICKLIRLLGHWSEFDIELIGESNNGEEAMAAMIAQKPDIVITDIKMPGISGLDMIKQATAMGVHSHYIIISGYQEFSYAKEAVQLGAVAYLLKPISEADLNSALADICGKIKDRNMEDEQKRLLEDRISYQAQTLRNAATDALVTDRPENKLTKYTCFSYPYFTLALFHFSYKDKDMIRHNDVLMPQFVGDSVSFLQMQNVQAGFYSVENEMYGLINYAQTGGSDEIVHALSDFLKSKYYSFIHVSCGVSMEGTTPERSMVNQAERAAIYRWIYGENSMMAYIELGRPLVDEKRPEVDAKNLHKAVELMDEKIMSIFWDGFIASCAYSEKKPYDVYCNLLYAYSAFAEAVEKTGADVELPGIDAFRAIILRNNKAILALYECKQFMLSWLRRVSETRNMADSYYIREAKAYIAEHCREPIVLEDIAGRIGISAVYFSEVFKRETGVSFKEYVTELRIRIAKDCLCKHPSMSISEVSDASGYDNVQYFCRVFKKTVGITPSQYRKLNG